MSISLRTNVASLQSQRQVAASETAVVDSMRRISSGYRITRGADDAAGLAISEKLAAKVLGYTQGIRNSNDGISMVQVADGGLDALAGIVQRVRELAVQAGNGTLAFADHKNIASEMVALQSEITGITDRTRFNGVSLLGASATILLQTGADSGHTITFSLSSFSPTGALASFSNGISAYANAGSGFRISAATGTNGLLTVSDTALGYINDKRSFLGAIQNRLDYTIAVQSVATENLSLANSRIRDADIAAETAAVSRNGMLLATGLSVLAQANQSPNMALRLLLDR